MSEKLFFFLAMRARFTTRGSRGVGVPRGKGHGRKDIEVDTLTFSGIRVLLLVVGTACLMEAASEYPILKRGKGDKREGVGWWGGGVDV